MLKHLFKMIWNKKKQNSLLISEILLSFLVIFGVFTFALNSYNNYATPMGFNYKQVWIINYDHTLTTNNPDSVTLVYETLLRDIKAMPQVIDASYHSANIPFGTSHSNTSITYKKDHIHDVNIFTSDENFLNTTGAKMIAGRWYNKADRASGFKVTVINRSLKERMFGKTDAIGQGFGDGDNKKQVKIIGVIDDIKYYGDYQKSGYAKFDLHDTSAYKWMGKILVKVAPRADASFESALYKLVATTLKRSNIEVEHLSNKLTATNKFTLVPLVIFSIVAAFLMINVALGVFGVLWYNINKRRSEIGLRRAVGATGNSVAQQLVSEALLLATLSLIIGSFFAVQFPLLNVFDLPAGVYLTAMFLAMAFIYLLVLVCSLYPGRQAAAVYPAVALHEE